MLKEIVKMTTIRIEESPTVLKESWVTRAKKLSTTLISDGLENLSVMTADIKPSNPNSILVGAAVTIDLPVGDNLALHEAMYASEPGHVMVITSNGSTDRAVTGELMVAAAQALQLNGYVIDGLIRDAGTLATSDFPVFSKGSIPSGPKKDGPGSINTPIKCGGLHVNPGDFIMGDADGVIVIPVDQVEEALTRAEKKAEYEVKRLEDIAAGNIRPKWLKQK